MANMSCRLWSGCMYHTGPRRIKRMVSSSHRCLAVISSRSSQHQASEMLREEEMVNESPLTANVQLLNAATKLWNAARKSENKLSFENIVTKVDLLARLGFDVKSSIVAPEIMRFHAETIKWKTICLKTEGTARTFPNLLASLNQDDVVPFDYSESPERLLQQLLDIFNRGGLSSTLCSEFEESFDLTESYSSIVSKVHISRFMITYLGTTPREVYSEWACIRLISLDKLVDEYNGLKLYGISHPNHILNFVEGIASYAKHRRFLSMKPSDFVTLLQLTEDENENCGLTKGDVQQLVKRGFVELKATLNYLIDKGFTLQHVKRAPLILGYSPNDIERHLETAPKEFLAKLEATQDKVTYLHLLFAYIDRASGFFYLSTNHQDSWKKYRLFMK